MLKTKIKSIWIYFEVFLLIMLSVSPLIPQSLSILLVMVLLAVNVFDFFDKKKSKIDKSFIITMIVFVIAIVFDMRNLSYGASYSMVNFMYPCYFVTGYFVAKGMDKDQFFCAFERIMFVLAFLSLIGMSICYVNPSLINSFPKYYFNEKTHRTIYFFNYLFSYDWMNVRNSGIAWEPGLFMVLLNIGLNIAIRKTEKRKLLVRVLVYGVACILTRSTIGYAVLLLNVIALIKRDKKYAILIILLAAALSSLIYAEILYQQENKLMGTTSFAARFEPMKNAFLQSWYRPFGIGSTQYNKIYEAQNLGSFDSWTQILLRFGFMLLFCVIERLIKIFKKDGKILALILFLSFFSQAVWGMLFVTVMYYLEEKTEKGALE